MSEKLVNITVNPCNMCMPMGAITAMYGIKKCVSLLHGSQGCSTYIRRHMATHYNEPVDIASSSLTEEGTVYGGEKNLIKGLLNLIRVYQPEMIAVATTCLAETIGEDIKRMIDEFYEEYPQYRHILIIPIHSAGYGGSQYEGYMSALYQLLKAMPMNRVKNDKVNIITGYLSPADTRSVKELLELFEIDYILLPDLSENLDRGFHQTYEKLPQEGTSVEELKQMGGARLTIELSRFSEETFSAGRYLESDYGVPYISCNPPVGLRDTDAFIRLLSEISGREIPEKLRKERAKLLDAMIDSHKINAEAIACIYGEPDFVYSTVRLCAENGIFPAIAATGSKVPSFEEAIEEEIRALAESYFDYSYEILQEIDFLSLEELAEKHRINIFIGNSDGRRIAHKLKIELVRRSFPIHDRLGGQRLTMLGYNGSLSLLDEISNAILGKKESSFREELYQKYYKAVQKSAGKSLKEKNATHPCFNCGAHEYARIHLPVAPKCNISCNYCVRRYDCPNESRPGVTSSVLKPEEAYQRFIEAKKRLPKLSVVGIAGPGDALANFPEIIKTLKLIRSYDPEVTFCISTNGLMLPQYADQLIVAGVSHVTVTMNTTEPVIGAGIYKYIDYMGKRYTGEIAAAILIANQLAGIRMLADKDIFVKVNIVMLKGINDGHIPELVKKVKELGAAVTNIIPLIPVAGSAFEKLPSVTKEELKAMRDKCSGILKQMYHCQQCRADAAGTLKQSCLNEPEMKIPVINISEGISSESSSRIKEDLKEDAGKIFTAKGILMAVASKSGILVDQHFGHASEFYVYEYINGATVFKEKRVVRKYCDGVFECEEHEDKMNLILKTIEDCRAVLAMRIGDAPREKLAKKGIRVFTTFDRIEASIAYAAKMLLQ